MKAAVHEAVDCLPLTTGVLCTVMLTSPGHVLVSVKVRTCEGEETQKMWQPNCQLQLEPSLGESILNANLVRYTQAGEYPQAGEESAIVQFHGQPCANVVGFDQLREQPL